MLFNSVIFITTFLPLALVGWFLLQKLENPIFAKLFIVGMSFWFYGYYNVNYLFILFVSIFFNYFVSALMKKATGQRLKKWLTIGGIFGNLGLLFYYKYFNFFVDNCNFFLHTDISVEKIALPLGISFFTFQQLSFLIERYRDNVGHDSFVDYAFFVSFFPQLIAGPIVLHSELLPQLRERKNRYFSAAGFYDGLTLFILGLGKKVLLADSLAVLVNAEYANIPALDSVTAWILIIWYMFELYFDFSGYCDMARGIAKMFGFWLPENFDSPLRAVSVRDFWRRWHMTLSRFLSQYIYIPLGGNRKGKARKCLNLFITFFVSGWWHGANWTFVLWGILHGAAMIFETLFPKARFPKEWMNRVATFLFVTLTFSIFRSDSLEMAGLLWKKLFAGGNKDMLPGVANTLNFAENYGIVKLLTEIAPQFLNGFYLVCLCLLTALSIHFLRGCKAEQWIEKKGRTTVGLLCLATVFTWSFISLSQVSVFLYFNF